MKRGMAMGMMAGAFALMFVLVGCEGEQGPAGPPGTASCMNCHTDQYNDDLTVSLATYQAEFEESQHNQGETWVRRGDPITPECSRCHTNEGHQHFLNTGEAVAVPASSKISCFTCHAPHTKESFELRQTAAVNLNQGGPYDRGTSNACVACHQVRNPSPAIADGANITSNRWGPHYGGQSNVLSAQGAYLFGGSPYPSAAAHYQANSHGCVTCHMARVPANNIAGGHSFAINYEISAGKRINSGGCTCHNFATDLAATTYTSTYQAIFDARLDSLKTMLGPVSGGGLGWLNQSDLVVPGTYNADEMGAIWNYKLLEYDGSRGVHNPAFTEGVMARTLGYVRGRLGQ